MKDNKKSLNGCLKFFVWGSNSVLTRSDSLAIIVDKRVGECVSV